MDVNKNEYRRGLIMLRPIAQGYSGHVRLERRTLMGSMYFIVNLPDVPGDLHAVLAGQKNGAYYAAEIGVLRRDGRGQANLAYSFDPRCIDGRSLEDYIFVVIARMNGCACQIVLSGNVDGSREADFEQVEQAVCELLTAECGPAADIPERPFPIIPPVRPEPVPRPYPTEPAVPEPVPRPYPTEPAVPEPVPRPYPTEPAVPEPVPRPYPTEPAVPEPVPRPYPTEPAVPDTGEAGGGSPSGPEGMPPDRPVFSGSARQSETAAERAGVDTSMPWASAIEGIRELFATHPAETLPFDDDFVYVRAPMPEGSGYPYVMIGIETDDGRVEEVRFALPGAFSPEPPAGLDGYVWQGGPSGGWWVLTVDPRTGNPIEFDD